MLGRTIFAATFFALAQFTVATPPGCLLGAVNQYEDPVDIKEVCKAKDLSSKVADICGDDADAAMSALKEICDDTDVEISTDASSSASGSKTPTASGSSHKPTGTSGATGAALYPTGSNGSGSGGNGTVPAATGGPKPSGSATGTGGIPESTGAAGKLEFGVAALVAGLMVAAF